MVEFYKGVAWVMIYYVVCASAALVSRKAVQIPDEVFRKTLHFILLGSLIVYCEAFAVWWHSALFCAVFAVVVYPVLCFFERYKTYSETVTERKKGELKSSLLIVFFMFATVISVFWGWLDDKMLVYAAVYAWGVGDAAAALIGKRFGKHKISGGKKSVEGTLAMLTVSFISTLIILSLRGGMPIYGVIITALAVGMASTAAELYTTGGFDTVSCPMAAMALLIPLTMIFG